MYGDRVSTFNDTDCNDIECARIELEDEENVPVLHYVHTEDVNDENSNQVLDLSRLDDEFRPTNSKKRKKRKDSKRSKDRTPRKDSGDRENGNIDKMLPPPSPKDSFPNENIPTVAEHVPILPEPKTSMQHYPVEYNDNMFLEAKLRYIPPVDEVPGELIVEKLDEAVQTPEILGAESGPEDRNEENVEKDVATVEYGTVEEGENRELDDEKVNNLDNTPTNDDDNKDEENGNKGANGSVKVKGESGTRNAKESKRKNDKENENESQTIDVDNGHLLNNSVNKSVTSMDMFTTCDNCGYVMTKEANGTASEGSWDEYDTEYQDIQTPTYIVPKSKITPIEVKGKDSF